MFVVCYLLFVVYTFAFTILYTTYHGVQGLFSKRRFLMLTDQPRLFYLDPITNKYMGEIPWTVKAHVICTVITDTQFDVLSLGTGRSYHLTAPQVDYETTGGNGAVTWASKIQAVAIQQHEQLVSKTTKGVAGSGVSVSSSHVPAPAPTPRSSSPVPPPAPATGTVPGTGTASTGVPPRSLFGR